ncbi:MAG TPA: hypothetical protein VL381_04815 [Rhodocyclaceae bacterium]|nr:hypothetical protein [Rhodocyclaceae bacterium]
MFNKLVGLFQGEKSDHPLGSTENLDQTLSEIPLSDPARVLVDVANHLEDISRYDTELSPAAIRRALLHIDTFAQPFYNDLLLAFVLPGSREHNSDLVWSHLDRHSSILFLSYMHCLEVALRSNEDLSKEKMQLAQCATRAMQAWVERKKLQHFRYRPPDQEWWSEAHKLVGLASKHGVTNLAQTSYPDDTQTRSTLHAYLAGLYLEMAPVSNLVTLQLEVLHRWLQLNAGSFEFGEMPYAGATHYIDLANPSTPMRYTSAVTHTATLRYCSSRRLRTPLAQFANLLRRTEALPEWLEPFNKQRGDLEKLVQTLLQYWAEQPPERASPRAQEQTPMRVVHGFALTRRMVACSAFAKRGKSLNYRGADMENLFNELRFGRSGKSDEEDTVVDPMETLLKLETSGDKQMMDEWLKVDASTTGVGAIAAGLRSRNRIGELVGFRFEGDIEWRAGIIRRIGRDKNKRASIGLEAIEGPSQCAQVRPVNVELTVWNEACEAGNGYVDAIITAPGSNTLLLPLGLFVDDLLVTLNIEGQSSTIVLTEKLDHGNDWERVRFQPAD